MEKKQIRDDWIKILKVKFNGIIKKRNAIDYEKNIVEEMEKDIEKYVNNEENLYENQKELVMRSV